MTDLEISKALALAIGYQPQHIQFHAGVVSVFRPQINFDYSGIENSYGFLWKQFDYRDWNVIGPIAAKYDCFPIKATDQEQGEWLTAIGAVIYADTPQKAIALAVIEGV